jgi:hypothetical protein
LFQLRLRCGELFAQFFVLLFLRAHLAAERLQLGVHFDRRIVELGGVSVQEFGVMFQVEDEVPALGAGQVAEGGGLMRERGDGGAT